MKKNLFILIVTAALIGGAFSFFHSRKDNDDVAGANTAQGESADKRTNIITENSAKYQPKGEQDNSKGPSIGAKAAIVVDQETNEILYSKNIHRSLPPASIIKVLTFATALEVYQPDDLVTITENASVQISNKINMKPGEKIKVSDLLYGMMMISANDAAYALADGAEGGFDRFVALANERVALLGLKAVSYTHLKLPTKA